MDGYVGYEHTQAALVGYCAHVYRKFKEVEQAAGKNNTGWANWALSHIQKHYRIEKALKENAVVENYAV